LSKPSFGVAFQPSGDGLTTGHADKQNPTTAARSKHIERVFKVDYGAVGRTPEDVNVVGTRNPVLRREHHRISIHLACALFFLNSFQRLF
jgi:hypothetical protein